MKYARFRDGERIAYSEVAGNQVHELDGAPFAIPRRTGFRANLADVELLVPTEPANIFCVGRNYRSHVVEMGFELPARPALFMKPQGALLATSGTVVLPPRSVSTDVQHEAELAIVIGREARDLSTAEAGAAILGYTVANDVSARDLQRSDTSVIRAKGFDTFCPLGPWVATDVDPDEGLEITCRVNGELRQQASTTDLIFDVRTLVSYLSRFTTLCPGDVVLTGSPGGSGDLQPGDEVEIEISGIGVLRHSVAAHPEDGNVSLNPALHDEGGGRVR